jgi:hypothetical protein
VIKYAHTRGVEQHSDFAQVMQYSKESINSSSDKNILTPTKKMTKIATSNTSECADFKREEHHDV